MSSHRPHLPEPSRPARPPVSSSAVRLVIWVCTAQVLVQLGAYFWPALLPEFMTQWELTNTAAGWITASFYGGYMLAVPVLVTLTDRVPAKWVYLFGVACTTAGYALFGWLAEGFWSALALRALAGVGWAGSYMTGLKLLADRVDARLMSRAVTGHVASLGVSGAVSYVLAEWLTGHMGWPMAFELMAVASLLAWLLVAWAVPVSRPPPAQGTAPGSDGAATSGIRRQLSATFDFGPVVRNRAAMSYAIVYCVHTLEMNALRGWGVAFLGYVAAHSGGAPGWLSPATVLAAIGLIGTAASVVGNESAIRWGRRRLVMTAMAGSTVLAALCGFIGPYSYELATALTVVWAIMIWLDSASLTAGTTAAAEPHRRGATLAIHSMLGYAGGFVGPLAVGLALDAMGGYSTLAWGISFALLSVLTVGSFLVFVRMRPATLVRGLND